MSGNMLKSFLTALLLVDVLRTQVCDALGSPSKKNRANEDAQVNRGINRQNLQTQATSDTSQTVSSPPLSLRPSGNTSPGNTSVWTRMENVKEGGDVIHVFTDLVGTLDKGATPSPAPPSPCNTTKIAPHERRIVILFIVSIIGIFFSFLLLPKI